MKIFENCTVVLLGGPCAIHVTDSMSPLNQPQSAIHFLYIAGLLAELHSCVEGYPWIYVAPPCDKGSKSACHARGYTHLAWMGKLSWGCISTGQDGSNYLDLECIGSVVAELQRPQVFKSVDYACGLANLASIGKWQWRCTSTGQDDFNEHSFQEHLLCPWVRPCGSDGQIDMTLHISVPNRFQWIWFWSESAKWLPSYGICKIWVGQTNDRTDEGTKNIP